MPLRVVANRLDPAFVKLPWTVPLEDWTDDYVVPLPRGLSRHVVRIISVAGNTYALKETTPEMAMREYRLLRDLQRLGLPSVLAQGVVTGREDPEVDRPDKDRPDKDRPDEDRPDEDRRDDGLPAILITEHLRFSLPYRSLFQHGMTADNLPTLIDAIVVLLVRLHLAGFYWGDVSLSNVLFRRAAGEFSAYLVDAETGELRDQLSDSMREYDVTVGCENIFAELLDLHASGAIDVEERALDIVHVLQERYEALWSELTREEEFPLDELWRINARTERLNELGFDVDELDVVTDLDGDRVSIRPKVVEAGHHARELQSLTGLMVEDNQARRLLNDLAAFTAHFDLGRESRSLVAGRWLSQIFEPIMAMVPAGARGKLDAAEIFHEILVHRWYLSERAGQEVSIFDTARDYIDSVLASKPDEAITPPAGAAHTSVR